MQNTTSNSVLLERQLPEKTFSFQVKTVLELQVFEV